MAQTEVVKPRLPDPEAYEKWEAVPVFDNQEGYPLPRLKQIAANSNSRFTRSGDLAVVTVGHTEGDDEAKPEVLKHPVVGFGYNFRPGKLGSKDVLLADLYMKRDHAELAKDFPRRSCELWYPDENRAFIDCVALLGKTAPARDLSLFFHRQGQPRRFEFKEGDHPRANDGKFGSGGGSGDKGGGKAPGKAKEPPEAKGPAKSPPKGKEPQKAPEKPAPKSTEAHIAAVGQKAEGRARQWLRYAAKLPKAALVKARNKVTGTYKKLEGRYGPKYAKAILGAGLLGVPLPLPGASFATAGPIIAMAELHRHITKLRPAPAMAMSMRTFAQELTPDEIDKLGKQFVKDCTSQKFSKEPMDEADVVRLVQQVLDNSDIAAWVRSKMAEDGDKPAAAEEPALNEREEEDLTVVKHPEADEDNLPEKDEEMEPHRLRCQRDQARRQLAKFQREVDEQRNTLNSWAAKFQRAENEKELLKLEAEGVEFDLADELDQLSKLDVPAVQHHIKAMRKNYKRSPVGVYMQVAQPKERGDEFVFGPAEQERALNMVRNKEVTSYQAAVNQIKGGK